MNNFTIQYQIDYNMITPNTLLLLEAYKLEIMEGIEETHATVADYIKLEEKITDLEKDIEALSEQVNENDETIKELEATIEQIGSELSIFMDYDIDKNKIIIDKNKTIKELEEYKFKYESLCK